MEINNVAYSWAMVQITAPGLSGDANPNPSILQGVTAIKWNRKRNIKTNYGLGGEPSSRGFGNREYSASITMDYNAQQQLRAIAMAAASGLGADKIGHVGLTELGEFDLTISFANEFGTSDMTTEVVTLKKCIFDEDGMEVQQDDTNITKEFNLNPFDIITNSTQP